MKIILDSVRFYSDRTTINPSGFEVLELDTDYIDSIDVYSQNTSIIHFTHTRDYVIIEIPKESILKIIKDTEFRNKLESVIE